MQEKGSDNRETERKKKSAGKIESCFCGIFLSKRRSAAAGDPGLDSGNGKRKTQGIDWKNQLIDPHTFRTNRVGEEYSIKEAHDPGDQTGQSEDYRSGNQRMFFLRRHKVTLAKSF